MHTNGAASSSDDIEEGEIRKEEQKGLGQFIGVHKSMQLENTALDEEVNGDAINLAKDKRTGVLEVAMKSTNERSDAGFSDGTNDPMASSSVVVENKSLDEHLDACSTPEASYRRTDSLPHSLVAETCQLEELGTRSSPRVPSGLDHCSTAPVGTQKTLFFDSHEIAFPRSMTEKRESTRHDLKLDRLSEREKQELIVKLVKIQKDGMVEVDLTNSAPVASELLEFHSVEGASRNIEYITSVFNRSIPRLKIAVLVVGTRGDVQPFLAVAKRLQEFGHHVRLATHANFCSFVKSAGIDFYPLGGDPRVLAGYMARNKGFIPSAPGEISTQRKQLKAIIESLLPACTEPDMETCEPFRAQAIIANPPSYGHAHVAEALGVPLHIFFTMPWTETNCSKWKAGSLVELFTRVSKFRCFYLQSWSLLRPTYEFPHPLARVPQSAGYWLSYIIVDLLIWWSVRGYINDFRKKKLKLPPIAYFSMYRGSISHFPTGYMWSPHVVPKPNDWGPQVDVVGYCFLNLGSKDQPTEEFLRWIQNGPKPIYFGFGSMPLEDPKKATDIILEALKNTGQRGIIDRGWGDLGTFPEIPGNVFLLDNCPHDWLFPQCSAVVHHGGAGTTATGLRAGCPTTIVPFFGDQFFWGDRICQKGLGPTPIPISQLSVESLSDAIRFMLQPEVKSRTLELAKLIENEDGVAGAVDAFHRHLHLPLELPLPTSSLEDNDHPNPLQWFFIQVGKLCLPPCGS